jgi:hypothetical protein
MYFLGEKGWIVFGIISAILIVGIAFFLVFIANIVIDLEIGNKLGEKAEILKDYISEVIEVRAQRTKADAKRTKEPEIEVENIYITKEYLNETENETEVIEVIEKEMTFRNFTIFVGFEEESTTLEKKSEKLNVDETIVYVFGDKINKGDLPIFLKDESMTLGKYDKKIILSEDFKLENFSDTIGFELSRNDLILDYEIDFGYKLSWDDIVGENIFILGREYIIIESNYDSKQIFLWEYPHTFILNEDEIVTFNALSSDDISIMFIDDTRIKLKINGHEMETLGVGEIYSEENFWILIEDILFSGKNGERRVVITFSPKQIILSQGELNYNSKDIDGIDVFIDTTSKESIRKIKISWKLQESFFLTGETSLLMPFFETLEFSLGEQIIDYNYDYNYNEQEEYYWKTYLVAKNYFFNWE